jgi:hypothetical protein
MKSDDEPKAPGTEERASKRPYSPPRIIEYGRAADLTGGGNGSIVEMMTGGAQMKHP